MKQCIRLSLCCNTQKWLSIITTQKTFINRRAYRSRLLIIAMDCSENQYYYKGECHQCQQCGPGQELSEECGYGSGRDAYCTSCNAKSFKEDWGHHSCRLCQSCKRVNRHEKFPCTTKSNAACGECLPGFYSKTRIDGLHDFECMPCGPSSASEHQCIRSRGEGVPKVWSTKAPPQGSASAGITGAALVAAALVISVFLFVYYRRASLRKIFEACAGSRKSIPSECDAVTAGTGETVILNLEKEVQVASPSEGLSAVDSPTSLKTFLKANTFLGSMATTSDLQLCYLSSLSETQPLMRCSTCSNCFLGCVSQRSSSSANSGEYLVGPSPIPFDEANIYCASDQKERHLHTPVECTELDFHSSLFLDGKAAVEIKASTEVSEDSNQILSVEQLNSPSDCSTNSCLNGYKQFCSSRCSNTFSSVQSLVKKSCRIMQGIHLGRLPQVLVESLALKLNPAFPGVRNYQQVALELGVPLEVLQNLQGFEHVFQYLSSCTLHTVPDLLNTFHHLQRLDAVLLLCEYATKSQPTACPH
ncbi:tumor necrosis factor receptor superfamily member 27 isoform X2 [Conger conger]|uniref:tumor necrosis factor receptor superfamily member 27 isoform X2 n=1 Tax=Conger conger TaxID=82655 RepID=UPI002A59FD65|nr:tumor necrosis factor receptor superfamily member 27 isoform X2 [Conger conger]